MFYNTPKVELRLFVQVDGSLVEKKIEIKKKKIV